MNGFNTRVEYRGAVYIVQTQDKGPASPYIESLIYKSGRLMTSKRKSYVSSLDSPGVTSVVGQMMEEQHKRILEEIVEGKFD